MTGREAMVAGLARLRRRRSFVLCYHGVGDVPLSVDPQFMCIAPALLREHVALLRDAGFRFCTVGELAATGPHRDSPPAPGLVALSFDDGWEDNHANLLPLLREEGVPATIYVAAGLTGRRNPWVAPAGNMRFMDAGQVRDCAAAGVEIGAHTLTHPDLSLVGAEGCRREVQGSRDVLRELTGQDVASFAYPYFRVGREASAAVAEAGFAGAVAGPAAGWGRHAIERVPMSGKDGAATLALKLTGAYDRLFWSVPGRLARTTTRSARTGLRRLREGRTSPGPPW